MIERHGTHVCKNPDCCGMIEMPLLRHQAKVDSGNQSNLSGK